MSLVYSIFLRSSSESSDDRFETGEYRETHLKQYNYIVDFILINYKEKFP